MQRRDFLHRSTAAVLLGVGGYTQAARTEGPAAPSKVRVGICGLSHSHALGKLSAVRDLQSEFELIGVAESDPQVVQQLRSIPELKDVRWMSIDKLLAHPGLQAVIVETAVRDQVVVAQQGVDARLHVHLEKPGGRSHVKFSGLLESAQQRGLHVQLGYMLRHNPAFEWCFGAVQCGLLGRVFQVSGAMSKLGDEDTRRRIAENSGGAMFELGCHLIDALVTMLGPPSHVNSLLRATRDDGLLDNCLAAFEYPDALATVRSSLVEPHGEERRHFTVSGENGTIEILPLETPKVHLNLQQARDKFRRGSSEVPLPVMPGRYHDQLRQFAAIVRGEQSSRWSTEHDLAVHRAVLQASGLPLDA